ncbi:MAG: hypothetical protein QXJ18_05370 [Desulfurococcaceae archaeon]
MTRLRPEIGSLKELRITMRTPKEELLSTPNTLPTTEPITSQIVYTVSEEDLPAFSMGVHSVVWVAYVIGAGRFTRAGTLYLRMLRNGASVRTGSTSVSANNYYTVNTFFYNVNVGDVLELRLWSSVSGSVWDYRAFQIQPTRILPHARYRNLYGVSLDGFQEHPVLTLGNPTFTTPDKLYVYHEDVYYDIVSSATTVPLIRPGPTYGLFRIYNGDSYYSNFYFVRVHTSFRPSYARNYVPIIIRFRFLHLD